MADEKKELKPIRIPKKPGPDLRPPQKRGRPRLPLDELKSRFILRLEPATWELFGYMARAEGKTRSAIIRDYIAWRVWYFQAARERAARKMKQARG